MMADDVLTSVVVLIKFNKSSTCGKLNIGRSLNLSGSSPGTKSSAIESIEHRKNNSQSNLNSPLHVN